MASAAPPRYAACGLSAFRCATLRVPLDRSGTVPGNISLHYARQQKAPKGAGVLVVLAGGPGQGFADAGPFVADSERAAARHYRIVTVDQRGTGRSGALSCPQLQRQLTLAVQSAEQSAACAARLGAQRASFTTADSVDDLEALRRALGVPRLALQGTSYGTYVALQYARTYPAQTDRLLLDSNLPPNGGDPFGADELTAIPRIVADQCSGGRCAGITADPVGELHALAVRLQGAPLVGMTSEPGGRRVRRSIDAVALTGLLFAGDLNPHLRAALPAAVHAALGGDGVALLRLVRPALGPHTTLRDLSAGLYTATSCTEGKLSYPLSTPFADRPAASAAALARLPPALFAVFPPEVVSKESYDEACRLWPDGVSRPPSVAPVPDVPALVLAGQADVRTPQENAAAVAALLPRSSLVTVPGTGHDEIDSDASGCVARALDRFFGGRTVGDPCATTSNQVPPQPVAPATLAATAPAPGAAGIRGRVLAAAVGAVHDVRETFVALGDAGLGDRAGVGLRAGTWTLEGEFGVRMRGVEWVPGVRVTGFVTSHAGRFHGTLRVSAPSGLGGELRFAPRRGMRGELGGHPVSLSARDARGAVPASIAARGR